MTINEEDRRRITEELAVELHAKLDGGRKNLIVETCPYCGHTGGKFGIYVGPSIGRRRTFMSHCFSCGHTTSTLDRLLKDIGRADLIIEPTADLGISDILSMLGGDDDDEIDDSLVEVAMPEFWRRTYDNPYLNSRGFTEADYEHFPVGTTRRHNFKFDDYVVFPVVDNGITAGYIARHTWSKEKIDAHNDNAERNKKYRLLRYRNSTENEFVKLLYNYDSVIDGETDTVVIVEGVFDVIALTRKLRLYDNKRIAVVATFGKKISDVQIFKLQDKGVKTVVVGYDGDAVESSKKAATMLDDYFDVYVADIRDPGQDFGSMDFWDIYDIFSDGLLTPTEFQLQRVQRWE